MTAAHSDGMARRDNVCQLAAIAPRLMVSTPPASLAGGPEVSTSSGTGRGSVADMALVIAPRPRAVHAARMLRSHAVRQVVLACERGETRDRAVELQFDGAGRAVALLADDHFGFAVHLVRFRHPFRELLTVGLHRLAHLVIIFLAKQEHHHVGVLLDRTRFTQVGELRAFVVAAL